MPADSLSSRRVRRVSSSSSARARSSVASRMVTMMSSLGIFWLRAANQPKPPSLLRTLTWVSATPPFGMVAMRRRTPTASSSWNSSGALRPRRSSSRQPSSRVQASLTSFTRPSLPVTCMRSRLFSNSQRILSALLAAPDALFRAMDALPPPIRRA